MDVENVDKIEEMMEYPLSSKHFTVDNVESAAGDIKDIIELDLPHKIRVLKKKSYMVHVSVGIISNVLGPAISIFDTGVGLNLIRT